MMTIRHRLFVLTDIENEPDDTQSLVRLLLYSNEIDLQGLVAVTSTWIRHAVHPESIHDVINGYEEVRPNLLRAYSCYPEAAALRKLVGDSVPLYGMKGVGEGHDSTGSEMLIKAVDREDAEGRPVHVALWGGANCLAQALWKVRKERSSEQLAKFISRVTVYGISDQDDAGPWIRRNFPMLPYVVSVHGENCYYIATWIAFASENANGLPGADPSLISKEWLKKNIQYGPLGSKYPDVMYGMEGDTPSYLNCIPNGLNDPCRPDFGGWGGRYKLIYDPEARHYHDACDTLIAHGGKRQSSAAATIYRWRDSVQRDFANRMKWTLNTNKVERPPVVVIDNDDSPAFVRRSARCGETVEVDASGSYSPDGRELAYRWFQYKEVGSHMLIPREVPDFDMHGTETSSKLKITMPKETGHAAGHWRREYDDGREFHLILEVTSGGEIPLTRYRRILLDVKP